MKKTENLFSLGWFNSRALKCFPKSAYKQINGIFITTVLGSLLAGSGQANAALVYDNGPINGTGAKSINNGYSVSDSFTVFSSTSLSSAQIGLWLFSGDSPTSVGWSIGTTPFGSEVSSGTGNLVNTAYGIAFDDYDIYESTFAISGSLAAGTYYLTLQNAVSANSSFVYWDENDGSSDAYKTGVNNPSSIGSESFQLYGTSSSVPDGVSTFLLLGFSSLSLIGAARWMRKSALS